MSKDTGSGVDSSLEAALVDLGCHLRYPPAPDVAPAVSLRLAARSHLERTPARRSRSWQFGLIVVAIVIVAGSLAGASPVVRAAVSGWFGIPGVRITHVRSTTLPAGLDHTLDLGPSVRLAYAQTHAHFHILLPAKLGEPDGVYLSTSGPSGVSLVYRARPGLPRTSSGVGLLVAEFKATANQVWFGKQLGWQSLVLPLSVGRYDGIWVHGPRVIFGYGTLRGGAVDHPRLAANTLLWERGGLTVRLESALSQRDALRVAVSFH